ncbi:hint-domain-containing protein, partial [Mycena pura]
MTERNKKDTWKKVSGLATGGNTNLWDGLKTGLNVLTGREKPRDTSETNTQQRLHALFLLTDGQPNVEPPRGHLPSLEAYLDAIPANTPRPSIHTFGFGYELDSSLLDALAHRGGGMYGFMPDSGMVGTVFVHAVANVACAWAASCQVSVEIEPEQQNGVQVVGAFPVVEASWGAQIQVGDILYGQSRDLIVRLPSDCFGPKATSRATVTAHYRPYWLAADAQPLIATASVNPNIEREDSVDLRYNAFRLSFVRAVKDLLAASSSRAIPDAAKAVFLSSLTQLQADPALASYAPAAALRTDIASEVVMAVESANWKRWGYHYLPSLARSHLRQQCANFKDPGLQVYGAQSALFLATRNTLSEKFDTLPPPTPSRRTVHSSPLHSMSQWQSPSGPCFAGTCEVVLGDGKRVRVEELRAEMQVRTPNGPRTVVGLLRTACAGGMTELVELDGLLVTPWHPVLRDGGEWAFPASLGAVTRRPCEAVYSILLQRDEDPEAHAVCVGGVWCVTLGHGAVEGV